MLETITDQLKPITKDRLTLKEVTELLDTKNFFASSDYHIFKYIKSLPNTLPAQDARVNPNFMVDIHNSTVKDNDIFLFLGDLSESELMDKPEYQNQVKNLARSMNGIKIMVIGNNDTMPIEYYYNCGFAYVSKEPLISLKKKMVFTHEPYDIVGSKFTSEFINMHGHIHGSKKYWNMNPDRHIDVYPGLHQNKILRYSEYCANYIHGLYRGKTIYHVGL